MLKILLEVQKLKFLKGLIFQIMILATHHPYSISYLTNVCLKLKEIISMKVLKRTQKQYPFTNAFQKNKLTNYFPKSLKKMIFKFLMNSLYIVKTWQQKCIVMVLKTIVHPLIA